MAGPFAAQVITAVLADDADPTELWLLYANRQEDDILLRNEVDALAAAHPVRCPHHQHQSLTTHELLVKVAEHRTKLRARRHACMWCTS